MSPNSYFSHSRARLFMIALLFAAVSAHAEPEIHALTEVIEGHSVGGVTTDSLGNVYIADFGEIVWKLTPEGKRYEFTSGLYGASGNAIDKQGNLLQSNFYGDSITKHGKLMTCSAVVAFKFFASLLPTAMSGSATTSEVAATPADGSCNVFELRQYTLKPGQRDVLIELFDREFIETQEGAGMRVYGQFRDEDRPERFVWIRAFADMKARERALTSFYSGPTWKAHGRQAAATMIDSNNVLLLHPINPRGGFNDLPAQRPPIGATAPPSALLTAVIYSLHADTGREFAIFFRDRLLPVLRDSGITPRAVFATEHSPNSYPALPVREGEEVVVWFASFENGKALATCLDRLWRSDRWAHVNSELETFLKAPPELLRLRPTGRSLLR